MKPCINEALNNSLPFPHINVNFDILLVPLCARQAAAAQSYITYSSSPVLHATLVALTHTGKQRQHT